MTPERLREILSFLQTGERSVDETIETLRHLVFEDVGFAKVDHHRSLRRGFPEVIFGPGKTPEQIVTIASSMAKHDHLALVTRTTSEVYEKLASELADVEWHEAARAIVIGRRERPQGGPAAVLSAGTSDIPVAEEAALTAELMGARVERLFDVGVAGLHRLLSHREALTRADVLVVVAGMDGALPSVVSGLTDVPVIAVPTSVGYGASFSGISALLAMLNSCSPGISVVNIDNGFGAGYVAGLLTRRRP
jgi:NCAIR mutase (PurE)-related protein